MNPSTPNGRLLAIAAGAGFAYGGLRIILGDALTDPSQWTTATQLTVLMVVGTIAAGHLMRDAWTARHRAAAAGFLVLFLAGTGLVVFNSVGRQAESTMLTEAQADYAADERARIKPLLGQAEAMLLSTAKRLQADCVDGKKGKGHCDGLRTSHAVYEAAVKGHQADLDKLGPPKPVNAKATQGAKIAALFGVDEGKAKAALMLIEPFLWTLFFELGSVISLGFAFRHRPGNRVAQSEKSRPATRKPPKGGSRGRKPDNRIVEFSDAYSRKHGRPPSGSEIKAAFPECPKSTAYDYAARARA